MSGQKKLSETLVTLKVSLVLRPIMVANMDNRERIRVKANELFLRYGIRSVSMDDIAGQLAISKKTIYQYYADKDELVDAVVDEEVTNMQGDCARCGQLAENAVHEIFLTMDQLIEQFRHLNPVVLYDLEKYHPASYRKFMKYRNEFLMSIVRNNLERGIKEGLYRPELNVDIISRFRLESMMVTFDMELFPPKKYNLADVSVEIIEHYIYGLASPRGLKLIAKYKNEQTIKQSSNGK